MTAGRAPSHIAAGATDSGLSDREAFRAWVGSALYAAELALHNGDAAPRRALWSRLEPASVLGAWRNARGQEEIDELFTELGKSFSDCTSYAFELLAFDVVGDMAYTVGLEHTSASVDGQPRTYTLRATQVYRREAGAWRVAHRQGDTANINAVAPPPGQPGRPPKTARGVSA